MYWHPVVHTGRCTPSHLFHLLTRLTITSTRFCEWWSRMMIWSWCWSKSDLDCIHDLSRYAFAKITSNGHVSLSDPWGDIEKPFEPSLGTPEFDPGFKVSDFLLTTLQSVTYDINLINRPIKVRRVWHIYPWIFLNGSPKGNLGEIAVMKHRNRKLRCQLSVGGAGDEITRDFQKIVKSEQAMRRFAGDCAELCEKYGFDGIDVGRYHSLLLINKDLEGVLTYMYTLFCSCRLRTSREHRRGARATRVTSTSESQLRPSRTPISACRTIFAHGGHKYGRMVGHASPTAWDGPGAWSVSRPIGVSCKWLSNDVCYDSGSIWWRTMLQEVGIRL